MHYLWNSVQHETQVHIQITILINDSNKSVGSALARFERSSLPDHKSTRTVMLRFLKIVAPVKCVLWSYSAVKVLDPGFGGFPWHIR